jgi:predicted nucleic-acid-binding protein
MRAVDTNLVVRYLTRDDPEQSPRARALINGGPVFMPVTVVLETEWVLRSSSRLPRAARAEALRSFVGLPTVTVGDADAVSAALDLFEGGMDFADALHLALASGCDAFATFDRMLVKAAEAAGIPGVQEP